MGMGMGMGYREPMKAQTNHSIIDNTLQRNLRARMTDAENHLWRQLRGRQIAGCKFRRQHPYMDYVLDFVCLEMRLVVEVDGSQHADSHHDLLRDQRLNEAGFRVLRFWNNQVLQEIDSVADVIRRALQNDFVDANLQAFPSPPQPSP